MLNIILIILALSFIVFALQYTWPIILVYILYKVIKYFSMNKEEREKNKEKKKYISFNGIEFYDPNDGYMKKGAVLIYLDRIVLKELGNKTPKANANIKYSLSVNDSIYIIDIPKKSNENYFGIGIIGANHALDSQNDENITLKFYEDKYVLSDTVNKIKTFLTDARKVALEEYIIEMNNLIENIIDDNIQIYITNFVKMINSSIKYSIIALYNLDYNLYVDNSWYIYFCIDNLYYPNTEILTTHLNLLNIIDNYLENDFNDLCQLVLNKNIIKSSFVRPLLNYLIINEIFKQNSNEYKGMFINKKECSLGKFDDYIEEFVKQDLYDCNSEKNRFLLFSFLIDEKILEVTDRNEIFTLYNHVNERIETLVNNKKLLKFEEKLTNGLNVLYYSIEDVDMMSGIEFERFLKLLFEKMGYSAEVTQQSNDQGVDIIVNNNDIKIAIQAKNYSDTVGKAAVQQVYTGMAYYKCNKSIVVTNNYFSKSAKDLAKSLNVELWDRDVLEIKLSNLKIIKSKIII